MVLVSVCIPTLNRPYFLAEAIHSVMAQTLQDFEIIVCDNNSDCAEQNCQVIEKINSPKIKYYRSPTRVTMPENWNNCLKHCSGRYIKYLMDDDLLHPKCLEVMVNAFLKYPCLVIASVGREIFIDRPNICYTILDQLEHNLSGDNLVSVMSGENTHYLMYLELRPFGTPTQVMLKANTILSNGILFDLDFAEVCDTGMWINILNFGDGALINAKLCAERKHMKQASKRWQAKTFISNVLKVKQFLALSIQGGSKNKIKERSPEFLTFTIILLNILLALRSFKILTALDFIYCLAVRREFYQRSPLDYAREVISLVERKAKTTDTDYLNIWLNVR